MDTLTKMKYAESQMHEWEWTNHVGGRVGYK
jgi:hypothetical protein